MTNVRRIQRYTTANIKTMQAIQNEKDQPATSQDSFFVALGRSFAAQLCPRPDFSLVVGC